MAPKVFVDTWGWLTLRDKSESRHSEAATFYQQLPAQKASVYTTDFILDETFTLLFKRLPFNQADESMQLILDAAAVGHLMIEWITPERFAHTQELRRKFHDKPNISFTDLSSMVVMQELGITQIITGDTHFTHVGLGFQPVS